MKIKANLKYNKITLEYQLSLEFSTSYNNITVDIFHVKDIYLMGFQRINHNNKLNFKISLSMVESQFFNQREAIDYEKRYLENLTFDYSEISGCLIIKFNNKLVISNSIKFIFKFK
jgi:hypothetical protein